MQKKFDILLLISIAQKSPRIKMNQDFRRSKYFWKLSRLVSSQNAVPGIETSPILFLPRSYSDLFYHLTIK